MKVNIPFYPRFKDPMLNDIKVLTSRTRAMGKKGDTFDAFGAFGFNGFGAYRFVDGYDWDGLG